MPTQLHPARATDLLALVLVPLVAGLTAGPALAEEQAPRQLAVAISAADPAGFEDLTGPQQAVVDIYFGGRKLGSAAISYRPGALTFADPAAVVALLPGLTRPDVVRTSLSGPDLPSNSQLVCTSGSDPAHCNRLFPEIAGIIFDASRFKAEIFINPGLLTNDRSGPAQYISVPESGLSVINSVAGVLSGAIGGDELYNLQNRLIVGDANRRLRADLAYSTGFGLQADRLAVEIDRPEQRYTAGLFWTPGSELTGRRKLLGGGIETQLDTRADKDLLQGNALTVFLNQRARVDILREGRLLGSRIYQPGNQVLDTSTLPEGSYEVELRIEEVGGARSSERRFFSRSALLPSQGQKVLFAYAGVLAVETRPGLISATDDIFIHVGGAKRLNSNFGIDGSAMLVGKVGLGQIGAFYLDRFMQIRVAGLAMTDGNYGGLLRVTSSNTARLAFDFDLRHVHVSPRSSAIGLAPAPTPGTSFVGNDSTSLLLARQTFTQFNGNLSYTLGTARVGVSGWWRRTVDASSEFAIGPSARVDLVRRGPWRVVANADMTITRRGTSGFVGFGLQLVGPRASISSTAGVRISDQDPSRARSRAVGSFGGSWQTGSSEGTELTLGAGYDRGLDSELISGSAELRAAPVTLRGDLVHNLDPVLAPTQYSVGFESTLALQGGRVALDGRNQSDSAVLVELSNGAPDTRFEVLVNNSPAGTIQGGRAVLLALAPYREYEVRIRQSGGGLASYDTAPRKVSLYPGTVARLGWQAAAQLVVFGQLIDASGNPISNASLETGGDVSQTDDNGYFQIQAAPEASIVARPLTSQACTATLPTLSANGGIARAGSLRCLAVPTTNIATNVASKR